MVKGTPKLRECPKKIRTRTTFKSSMTIYISKESLINVVFDKNLILATSSFTNSQEPISRQI